MEQKLGLKSTLGMISDPKQNRKENIVSSRNAIFIKSKIDEYLLLVNSIEELKEALLKEEIETEIGRGISFKYQNERFKGSDLGREYSLMNLERRLESKSDLKETLANEPFSLIIESSNSNLEGSELSKKFSLVNLEKELKPENNFEKSIDSNPKLENSKLGNEFSFTNSEKELKPENNFEETFKNGSFSLKTESSNSNSNFKDSKLDNEFSFTNSEKEIKHENNFEDTFKNESFSLKIESSNTETEDTPAATTSIKLGIETSGGGAPPAIKSNSMDEEEKKRLQKLKMKNKMKR